MIVTWRIALRIALLVVLAVVLQNAFFSSLWILGATPDILPVLAVALGLLGGALVGAVAGFATGFLVDSALLQTLGVSSLSLLAAGYLAGRYREGFEITSSFVPLVLTGALALLAAATYAAVQLMLGVETPVSLLVLREIVIKALLAVLLAIPIYPLVRRALRPALIDEGQGRSVVIARSRRRRPRPLTLGARSLL
jgi:rod shape-determining protein MreD